MIRFRTEALTYFWYFKKGRLFETGRLLGTGIIFWVFAFEKQQNVRNRALTFIWKASSRLGNGFVVPGSILNTTTSQAIIAKFADKIICLKELWTHVNIIVETERKTTVFYRGFNPLHPNMTMHISHTVLYTFPKMPTGKNHIKIKSFFNWWSFPLFSWP